MVMKKICVFLSFLLMSFVLVSCGKSDFDVVEQNMSERTDIYFFGQNQKLCASLAYGQREKSYLLDGKSGDNTDFSLLTISFFESVEYGTINVVVSIDDSEFAQELEYVPTASAFVCDLEKTVSGSEKIEIKYEDNIVLLDNLSKNFGVDSNKAIEIGCEEFKEEIEKLRKGSSFDGEAYLKILDKRKNNFENFFWCFTLIDLNGNSFSAVISTVDGKILAKS